MDSSPKSIEMIQQVIQTCPSMNTVALSVDKINQITSQKWKSISEALKTVRPMLTLRFHLRADIHKEASNMIQDFLHECPNPVHLQMHGSYLSIYRDAPTFWIRHLLGSSVLALSLNFFSGQSEQILHHLTSSNNTTLKELHIQSSFKECSGILDAMQDLAHLEKLTLNLQSSTNLRTEDQILPLKPPAVGFFQQEYLFEKDLYSCLPCLGW
jgi:hypothetical protein